MNPAWCKANAVLRHSYGSTSMTGYLVQELCIYVFLTLLCMGPSLNFIFTDIELVHICSAKCLMFGTLYGSHILLPALAACVSSKAAAIVVLSVEGHTINTKAPACDYWHCTLDCVVWSYVICCA